MEQTITCINCPVGCRMTVTLNEAGEVSSVTGNTCQRGARYAHQECTLPLRTITAVVPVDDSETPLSVKTSDPIPKRLIPEVMAELMKIRVSPPVAIGQVLLRDVYQTGVSIVATRPLS